MKNIETGKTAEIGSCEHVARKLTTAALSHTVLKSEVTDKDHSIDKAEKVLRDGKGLIIIINHFSLKDPPLAVIEVFRNTVMGSRKIITPIAYHMDRSIFHRIGEIHGVTFMSIVTRNTIEKGKNNGRELNDGMKEYLNESLELLKRGGIVILSPQGTRMPHLVQPDNSTVGTFMAAAKKRDFDKYAFLLIGFGIKGVEVDYSRKRGLNLFEKYTVNMGACLTSEEILTRAGRKFKAVDGIIFEELRKIVPNNYK